MYILAVLSLYALQDAEVGGQLLCKGTQLGNDNCSYELAITLQRKRHGCKQAKSLLRESASRGHMDSRIELWKKVNTQSKLSQIPGQYECFRQLLCKTSLIDGVSMETCFNPHCTRVCPNKKTKRWKKMFDDDWICLRKKLLFLAETNTEVRWKKLRYLPPLDCCNGCRKALYCSKVCQRFHWKSSGHRKDCTRDHL